MRPWIVLLLSVLLYVAACLLPVVHVEGQQGFWDLKEQDLPGYFCLIGGLLGFMLVAPLLFWLANPWLWFLWIRTLMGRPITSGWAWAATGYAVAVLIFLQLSVGTPLLVGAYVWVAAFAVGSYAAMQRNSPRHSF